jgi:antitoxin HicB
MKNKHIGTGFDDFLQEEGLLAATEATAVKRVIAYQIEKEMAERQISKSTLARMMQTSRSALDRLLDPENASVTLLALESVAQAFAYAKKLPPSRCALRRMPRLELTARNPCLESRTS